MQTGLPVTPLMMAAALLQLPSAATSEAGKVPSAPIDFGDELAKLLSAPLQPTSVATTPTATAQPAEQMEKPTDAPPATATVMPALPVATAAPAPQEANPTKTSRETPTGRRIAATRATPVDVPLEQQTSQVDVPPTRAAPPVDPPPLVAAAPVAEHPQERTTPAPLPHAELAIPANQVSPAPTAPVTAKQTEPKPAGTDTAPSATAPDAPVGAPPQPTHVATETISSPSPLPTPSTPAMEMPAATTAPTPPHATSPAAQLAPAIVQLAHAPDGAPRLTMRLDPPELGHVQIRIDRPPEAPARIEVTVEKAETLTLLLRDQPQLQRALDQAGVPAEGRNVTFHIASPDPTPRNEPMVTAASNVAAGGLSGDGSHGAHRQGGQQAQQQNRTEDTEDAGFVPIALPGWIRGGLDITA